MTIFPNPETRINIEKNEELLTFTMTHQHQKQDNLQIRNNFATSNTNTKNYTITNNNNIIANSGLINRDKDIFVESLVDTTASLIETIWYNFPVVSTAQIIPLRLFIKETLKRSRTFLSTLKIAQLYLFRIQPKINSLHSSITTTNNNNNNNAHGPSSDNKNVDPATCGRRMFLASLIVASKYLQDKNYSNTAWSKICGLQVKEINMVERRFLQLIVYNLYVSEESFDNWTNWLNSDLNMKLSSLDDNNNNNTGNSNNNNGGGDNNSIHYNNSNSMNFQASNNNNGISMNVQTSSNINMDAYSFENPNLSIVLPPIIIMSRSKECHVRG